MKIEIKTPIKDSEFSTIETVEIEELSKKEKIIYTIKRIVKEIVSCYCMSIVFTILVCTCLEHGWIFNIEHITSGDFGHIYSAVLCLMFLFLIMKAAYNIVHNKVAYGGFKITYSSITDRTGKIK